MNIEHRKLSVKEKEIRSKENIAEKITSGKSNKNIWICLKDRNKVIEKRNSYILSIFILQHYDKFFI